MKPTAAHLITRAASNYKQGSAKTWAVCFDAARLVGQYERGATLDLAKQIRRSVDTVENYAIAGRTYNLLRDSLQRPESVRKLRECRRELSYLHFSKLGRRWGQFEFSPIVALNYLLQAVDEQLNDQAMDAQIVADFGTTPPKADILPVWSLSDGSIERLRRESPGAYILVLPGLDWQDGDEARVTRVRKSK